MAIGDDAAAAGMTLVNGATTDAKDIDTEINRSRDYIAQFFNSAKALVLNIWPTNRGGTGSSNVYGLTTPSAGVGTAIMMIQSSGRIARGTGALPPSYIPNLALDQVELLPGTLAALEARIAALERRAE